MSSSGFGNPVYLPRFTRSTRPEPEPEPERVELHQGDDIGWGEFLSAFQWEQGEHVSMVGPTGGGKTTLAIQLLPIRKYVAVLATKPADDTLSRMLADGYRRIYEWPPGPTRHRVMLWPRVRRFADIPEQRRIFLHALDSIFEAGAWCVFADELYYLAKTLNLDAYFRVLWQQGRSIKISLVAATQRPAWVPLEAYSQATHVFFWRTTDRRDLDRIAGLGGSDSAMVRRRVAELDHHQVLYVNTRSGTILSTSPRADG